MVSCCSQHWQKDSHNLGKNAFDLCVESQFHDLHKFWLLPFAVLRPHKSFSTVSVSSSGGVCILPPPPPPDFQQHKFHKTNKTSLGPFRSTIVWKPILLTLGSSFLLQYLAIQANERERSPPCLQLQRRETHLVKIGFHKQGNDLEMVRHSSSHSHS